MPEAAMSKNSNSYAFPLSIGLLPSWWTMIRAEALSFLRLCVPSHGGDEVITYKQEERGFIGMDKTLTQDEMEAQKAIAKALSEMPIDVEGEIVVRFGDKQVQFSTKNFIIATDEATHMHCSRSFARDIATQLILHDMPELGMILGIGEVKSVLDD